MGDNVEIISLRYRYPPVPNKIADFNIFPSGPRDSYLGPRQLRNFRKITTPVQLSP